jgi:tetratricopeptide (TPR) repeat protein
MSGKSEKAIQLYENLAKKNPTRVAYQTVLAELYEQMSQLEKAEQTYRTVLLLKTPEEEDFHHLAWIQIRMKHLPEALETLSQARRQFVESPRLAFLEALAHRDRKDYERALASFAEVKALAKGKDISILQGAYYLEVALTEEMAGKLEQSQATLIEGLKVEPENPGLQNALAYHWADRGIRLDEAQVLSKKSLEKLPGNAAFIDTLGWIYFKMGRYGEALPLLEQALAQTKEDPEVLAHLAEIYEKLGRTQDAVVLWQKVLVKNPDDEVAVLRLKSAQEALKELNAKRTP